MFHDPARMIWINVVAFLLLLGSIFIYRFIYPKKHIPYLTLIILFSLLPLTSLLRPGDYESGDFNIHINRIMSFYQSLREGIFIPSWASELNGTYGLPTFIFNYSFPYYIISLFHWVGLSFITSMKLFLGLTFFLSGLFMFFYLKKIIKNDLAAFTGTIFYLYAPYHLIDVHFRATPGESLIYAFIPIVFYFIYKYFEDKKFISLILTSISIDLLFMAHPLLATLFLAFIFIYILFLFYRSRDTKFLGLVTVAIFMGVLSSIYAWAPFIIYASDTYKLPPFSSIYFYPFQYLFYSPYRLGFLFQGPKGELAQIIGYAQVLMLILSAYLIIIKRNLKGMQSSLIFWVGLSLLSIFLMHPLSATIWRLSPTIQAMTTPYARILLITNFCVSIVTTYCVLTFFQTKRKRIILYVLLITAIGSTILNWGHRRVIPEINDSVLQKNAWKSIEITPYFMNSKYSQSALFWFPNKPKTNLEVMGGTAQLKSVERTTTLHTYVIDAKTPVVLNENTLYFPGWTLTDNSQQRDIFPGKEGQISIKLGQGLRYIELKYEDITIYKLTKIISTIMLTVFIFLVFWQLRKGLSHLLLHRGVLKKHLSKYRL